tara:strand:+ start:5287 stop:5847 length:561 start_codon:yes stop_codon:yes gene_type:complete
MGNDIRNKGLLLDEADFAIPRDCDMETLTEAVEEFLIAEFSNEFDLPFLEILGVVSESLNQTTACPHGFWRALWAITGRGFNDIFLGIAAELGISETLALNAIATAQTEQIEAYLETRIREDLDSQCYYNVKILLEYFDGLKVSGVPGVSQPDIDDRGEDVIIDYRVNNYGPGRRILAEISLDWGQ